MIPEKAIKPIKKNGRDSTDLAVGTLIAYRVFPQTQEGIDKAKKLIANSDEWLVPSMLPEYYNDIDSDLMTGKETPGITSIRNSLKEFYGLTTPSSGTQDFVDTREVLPQALVTKKVNHPKLRSHLRRASNYQNRNQRYFLNFESDIDKAIYHTKKVSGSPTTAFKEGIRQWLFAITGLNYDNDDDRNKINNYRQIILNYINTGLKKNSIKKTISESKTTENNNITLFVPTIYDGPFTHVDKTEDQIKDEHNKEVEEVKKLFNKNINHPKLYKDIGIINTLYPVGGRFERINFRSDIDKAIYFSIKGGKSDSEKKQQVREWLFQVTGLQISDSDLTKYREKIIDVIRIVLKYELDENYREDFYTSEIPIVYNGYFQDPDNEEDEEDNDEEYDDEEDTEEYDDLYGSNLDDLLNEIKEDEKEDRPLFDLQFYQDQHNKEVEEAKKLLSKDQDQKQVIENIEEEIVQASDEEDDEEGHIGSEDDIPDELLQDDVDPKLLEKLLVTINKPKKESSYTSNKKIFDSMVVNFGRLQSTLDTINNSLEKQNSLIKANIDTQLAIGELVSNQTELLGEKFDAILKEFEKQSDRAKDIADDEKRKAAEDSLEGQRDAAGTRDIDDLTKGGGKSKRGSKIADYYKQKALRRLYRAMPKRLRGGIRKARKIKQTPSRIAARMTRGITNRMPSSVKRVASGASAIKSASKMTNIPGAKTGPLRTLFAGMEYGERKGSGQSELQALGGTGAGLAGGAAGGVGGAKIGAIAGTAIGGAIGFLFGGVGAAPGAAIGLKIGTVAGSLIGGWLGAEKASELADKVTGVHETGGLTKPGTALLHGTEAVINPNAMSQSSLISDVGGMFIGATTGYLNAVGPMAAPVAPVLKGISAQMAKQYDVPSTLTQTNVGGSLPNLSGELKKVKEKGKQTPGEELSGIEKDLLETQDPESFADKLMKMLDPEGKFQQLLQQINHNNPVGETGEGMATFGESGIDKGTGHNAKGWVHGHFQNSNKQSLVSDTLEVVKKLINSGVSTVITATNKDLTKDMSEDELRRHIESGVDGHKKYGSGVYAIDVSVPTGTKVPYELENVFDSKGPGGIVGTMKGRTTQVMHLAPGSKAGAAPGTTQVSPGAAPTGDFDVIIPLDHVKPGNEQKIPDKKGGTTFENARATGAAGRERDHQDKAAAKVKAKLEAKGLRVKVITPEDFGNYEDYDKYIKAQASKNVRIVPLHFDAAVGQGGTGFLTRTKKGDSGDAALAKPIQQKLSSFQKANPSLGNLGPTDTVSNATINRASASPAALVEMGSMVAWEKQHGSNFTSTNKFDELATGIAEGVYQGGGFNNKIKPPTQQPRFQSLQGKDGNDDTKYLIVNQQAKPQITGQGSQSASSFVSIGDGKWRSQNEMSTTIRNLYMQRLGQ